jgi:hypothetical protein
MSTIRIVDSVQGEIISANPIVTSGFGKYLKGLPAQLLAGTDFVGQFRQSLTLVQPGQSGFRLAFDKSVPLGDNSRELTLTAGTQAFITVHNRSGKPLFDETFLGNPVKVPAGRAYVSFVCHPSLSVGITQDVGKFSFGFQAGTDIELRCFHDFDLSNTPPTLGEAVKTVLEHFAIPADVEDLRAMQEGTLASVTGHGQFRFSGSVDLTAAFNPLASIDTIAKLGKLDINATGSLEVGVSATFSGDYQIRLNKTGAQTVQLSIHKIAARELAITVEAAAGPDMTLGKRHLLKSFLSKGSKAAQLDIEQLVETGLSNAQIDTMTNAIQAGMRRTLNLTLNAEFSSLHQNDAAFLYEIDLSAVDAVGESAVQKALRGDLTALNALEEQAASHGIRVLQSRLQSLRRKRITWRVNLLGIVNVLSLSELLRKGTVFHDAESGELVITDAISLKRMGAVTEMKNVRRVLYESMMLTATYKAGGLDGNTDLSATQSFFAFERNANRQRLEDFLDAIVGIGLMGRGDSGPAIGDIKDFGPSTFLLEAEFNQAACKAMFLDEHGKARPAAFFESIGRKAVLALVRTDEDDAYRRIPMQDDALWKTMKNTGQPGFGSILPAPISGSAIRVGVIQEDYSVIVWWADAMSTASGKLAEMQAFLTGAAPAALDQNPEFRKKRDSLQKAMAAAISKNKSNFGDPWGLLALFAAAQGKAEARASIVSPKLSILLP